MDISILLDIRGGSPSPRRDPRPPRMLVFKGINVPQSRLDDDSDYDYGKGLQSYRFPASPVRSAGRFVLGSPASSISSTYPRSVSSASDTSYHEVDPHHAFASDPGPSSPSYMSPSPSEWDDRWGEDEQDERPAGGVWSPTFGPRPSIDRDHEGRRYSSASRQDSFDEEDGDWDADDSPLSQDLLFERPANSSFKGLDSASSDVPHEYLESQFSPDRRKRSLSHEDVESLPPFHIICWTSAGQEKLWTPDDPYSKKILDAYLAEDPRGLEPGIYVWHDESGEESTLHVFDPKTRASREQNEWKQTLIADAKKACPLPPHLAGLQVGFVSVMPREGRDEDEQILVPDNCISVMLSADKRWNICDLPTGFVYRWREISGKTFVLDTGPSQFESSTRQFETFWRLGHTPPHQEYGKV